MMAIKMGLNPNARHTWPINTINNLIIIEDNMGDAEANRQIQRLLGRLY